MSYAPTRTGGATVSHVDSLATTQSLLVANVARLGVVIVNTDANSLYIKYGATATVSADGWTYIIGPNGTWEMPVPLYSGKIDGIWAADGAGYAEITEY